MWNQRSPDVGIQHRKLELKILQRFPVRSSLSPLSLNRVPRLDMNVDSDFGVNGILVELSLGSVAGDIVLGISDTEDKRRLEGPVGNLLHKLCISRAAGPHP